MAKLEQLIKADYWRKGANKLPDIYAARRQLAKAANQRMVRLEQTKSGISGESYAFGAYDIAQSYLQSIGRKSAKAKGLRFSETIDRTKSYEEVRQEVTALQAFLSSKSSRVGEQKKFEKARIKTFKGKGISEAVAASKEFYDFLNSKSFESISSRFDSDKIIELFDTQRERKMPAEKIKEIIDDFLLSQNGKKGLKDLIKKFNAVKVKRKP